MTSGRRLEALMDAMDGTPLTANQRYVVLCLARHADHRTGRGAWPGLRRLAADARCKPETAARALDLAKDLGIIAVEHKSHGRTTSWAILPRLSPESEHRVSPESEQGCPPGVPQVSRSGGTTTRTTAVHEESLTGQTSPERHTLTTVGGRALDDPEIEETGNGEAGELARRLLGTIVGDDPTAEEIRAARAFARQAVRNGVTDPQLILRCTRRAHLPTMREHVGEILREAVQLQAAGSREAAWA